MEEYELAIEEQAYPFEEKAISVHESNLELMSRGVYNKWIDKSLERLAGFIPARYAKSEEKSAVMTSLSTYKFEFVVQPSTNATGGLTKEAEISQDETDTSEENRVANEQLELAESQSRDVPSDGGQVPIIQNASVE
jgi:hypothetical protein